MPGALLGYTLLCDCCFNIMQFKIVCILYKNMSFEIKITALLEDMEELIPIINYFIF